MATRKPQFQDPQPNAGQQPTDAASLAAGGADDEAAQFEPLAFLASVDSQIMAVKRDLEKLLDNLCRQGADVRVQASQDANIAGVGIGVAGPTATACAPGDPVLEVYTLTAESHGDLCTRLASVIDNQALADHELPMNVVHTGPIRAQQHDMRLRPAPGGAGGLDASGE